jgi:hypothetical protein
VTADIKEHVVEGFPRPLFVANFSTVILIERSQRKRQDVCRIGVQSACYIVTAALTKINFVVKPRYYTTIAFMGKGSSLGSRLFSPG